MTFQSEIADTSDRFTLLDLKGLEAMDKSACAAMEAWLFDPSNEVKIEALKNALEARAHCLADHGTALIKIARYHLMSKAA